MHSIRLKISDKIFGNVMWWLSKFSKDEVEIIFDDTDDATVKRVKPIYDLLYELGFKTTKTVWAFSHENDRFEDTETLENPEYLDFIKDLANKGFEIATHGARGISSKRELTVASLSFFREKLDFSPRMHINHAQNKDNLYWAFNRLFKIQKILHKTGIKKYSKRGIGYGADKNTDYFWGDIALETIDYVRAGSFRDINTYKMDSCMPYYEKRFPYARAWFSGSDGTTYKKFINLLSESKQKKLVQEKGLCIVNTHFGVEGFLGADGKPSTALVNALTALSNRNGWFVPATDVLDFLKKEKGIKRVNSLSYWHKTRNR
jgi:hypothetical protein